MGYRQKDVSENYVIIRPDVTPIHTSADNGDKLSAEGMTLIDNAVLGLLLELDAR